MTKKDISELKKRYTTKEHNFSRIAGCYVTSEKEIISTFTKSPMEMEEDEFPRYLEIAKKSLSGKVDNNLLMFPFKNDSNETSKLLERLKKSELKDNDALNELYQLIINNYECVNNYLIVTFMDTYDIPLKASDGADLGESEYVFSYILTAICPVKLSKQELGYRTNDNTIGALVREWTAAPVENAFMYPAYSDRSGDAYRIIAYSKKPDAPQTDFWENGLMVKTHMSEAEKKKKFADMLDGVTDSDKDKADEQRFNIADSLSAYIENKKTVSDEDAPVDINTDELKEVLEDAGLKEGQCDKVVKEYSEIFVDEKPLATDLLDQKCLKNQKLYHEKQALQREVSRLSKKQSHEEEKSSGIAVTVPDSEKEHISVKEIDGTKYVLIPADGAPVSVNGESIS